ncbi:protein FAM107B isoform X2 [Austrofundulus limnaeus]|uniref:Protein FAM107B isoform X2 n=1 Tax=Austrofundulus limnaeus TaxID=52670 RepID=A0A2I4APH4_AUSLI|nr:PREDICTED: protein FAM107B-like isoform X2 [Austrofundulus limnaeus]
MRLYQSTQISQKMGIKNKTDRTHCWMNSPRQVTENQQQEEDDLIKPQKLINPLLASLQHRALHQELLFCHRRGVLPRRKPELQCVLENKRREQLKKRELQPASDLEMKLHRRQQKIQLYELEEKKWRESLQNVPEFVRVRQTLKHIPNFSR